VRLEGLRQLKISNDLIGNHTRDLPACSVVPQPTTLPSLCDNQSKPSVVSDSYETSKSLTDFTEISQLKLSGSDVTPTSRVRASDMLFLTLEKLHDVAHTNE
jgi:hypothetical protein